MRPAALSALGRDSAPASKRSSRLPTFTGCEYVRNGPIGIASADVLPRSFPTRMSIGIWPPSKPAGILFEPDARLLALDATSRVAALARAQPAADPLAGLARLRRLRGWRGSARRSRLTWPRRSRDGGSGAACPAAAANPCGRRCGRSCRGRARAGYRDGDRTGRSPLRTCVIFRSLTRSVSSASAAARLLVGASDARPRPPGLLGLRLGALRATPAAPRRSSCRGAARRPRGERGCCRPLTVARVMLIGVVVPRLFASTSRMPASSSTARVPPPAMTPVPSLAGRRTTRAASNRPDDLVGDRLPVLRDGEEVLPRVLDGLRDRQRDLARLPVAEADAVDLVADDDERGEREPPAALHDLGDAVDLDDPLLQLAGFGERRSKLEPSFARALGEGLHASVVQVAGAVEHARVDTGLLRQRPRAPCRPRSPARSSSPTRATPFQLADGERAARLRRRSAER